MEDLTEGEYEARIRFSVPRTDGATLTNFSSIAGFTIARKAAPTSADAGVSTATAGSTAPLPVAAAPVATTVGAPTADPASTADTGPVQRTASAVAKAKSGTQKPPPAAQPAGSTAAASKARKAAATAAAQQRTLILAGVLSFVVVILLAFALGFRL